MPEDIVPPKGDQQVQVDEERPKKAGRPPKQKVDKGGESQEVPSFKFSVSDLLGEIVEMRLTSTRDGDSTVCGVLAGMDDFFIYITEGEETTAYNSAHMISIRARRPMPASKVREGFASKEEDAVVMSSQDDIERQKAANRKRREEVLNKQREKISSQRFS